MVAMLVLRGYDFCVFPTNIGGQWNRGCAWKQQTLNEYVKATRHDRKGVSLVSWTRPTVIFFACKKNKLIPKLH